MSLRSRLFLVILVPLLLVSVLLGVWRYSVAQRTSEQLFDRSLLAAALAISRDVTVSEGDALSPSARALISDAGGGEVFYHVTGPGGIYVTGYAYPPSFSGRISDDGPHFFVADYRGERVRVLRMSETTTIDNLTGKTVVTVWQRVSDRQAFATELARRAVILIAGLMAALAVVVWFGVAIGLRPLLGLHDAIARRSPNDLSVIQRPVPAEVSGIVATLNRLLGQVEDSIDAHKAFISDAAHQLRNPASALLSLAETLPAVHDPAERQQRERELIDAARNAAHLTEQLLRAERLHHGGLPLMERFDLNAMAERVCADQAPAVLARDIDFTYEPQGEPVFVQGDTVLLGEALANLIDNALKHGGPRMTEIIVSIRSCGTFAEVLVCDDGRGIPSDKVDVAFRRFGQLGTNQGSGLGLAIVQDIACKHNGDVKSLDVAQGACIRMRLALRAM
ncbi:sensor histidine kinase [Meridianimarinicoccus roseus]|uniref:histidine kinase n=2 Tax=Meridianimarinicoccus roseus TaxID=2072018 RepID=A0A2V2L5U0_9RHOB|nr:sensor histidine kinase [Meridianimarinicoccus roseus]